ncbi:Signal peptidase complex subunit 1 [Paragonimus heterotremus]|uniref:Signal peptidase complex subunit 1 n=1 Tax=Paragonimus heterotremus TaxID=100268 RepID=A0A8J4WDK4_9TREM|nr:Signal peptidase complex subunit 1 [Paragonimus heterotremus]
MDIVKYIRNWADDHHLYMDYKGQQRAEWCMNIIMVTFFLIAFPLGYYKEMLSVSVYTLLAGTALSAIIVLPPWPCFRRHPLKWQKPLSTAGDLSSNSKPKSDSK